MPVPSTLFTNASICAFLSLSRQLSTSWQVFFVITSMSKLLILDCLISTKLYSPVGLSLNPCIPAWTLAILLWSALGLRQHRIEEFEEDWGLLSHPVQWPAAVIVRGTNTTVSKCIDLGCTAGDRRPVFQVICICARSASTKREAWWDMSDYRFGSHPLYAGWCKSTCYVLAGLLALREKREKHERKRESVGCEIGADESRS